MRPGFWMPIAMALCLAACAGSPPVEVSTDTLSCPDLTGSYCATGQRWNKNDSELEETYLPYNLGIEFVDGWKDIDRVDLSGVADGVLKLSLHAGDRLMSQTELRAPEFKCGEGQLLVKMNAMPWSGGAPLLAFGGSGGWRLFQRGEDGALLLEQKRRETGSVMLVIPLVMRSESAARFPAYGNCE